MSESSPHLHVHLVPRAHDADVPGFDVYQRKRAPKSDGQRPSPLPAAMTRVAPSWTRSCGFGGAPAAWRRVAQMPY